MLYLDASCLVKLLRPEPFTREVRTAAHREPLIVVSILSELEALIQIRAGHLGGAYKRARMRAMEQQLEVMKAQPPFEFRTLPASTFTVALRQHRDAEAHCRTLDRLHLAAMEELGVERLLTHDERQAEAARGLGFEVLMPRDFAVA